LNVIFQNFTINTDNLEFYRFDFFVFENVFSKYSFEKDNIIKSIIMKKFLLIFGFIISGTMTFAQTDWAPVGAKWFYNNYSGGPEYLTIIESIGDTIINTRPCKILETYEITSEMDSTGANRWDTLYCPKQFTYMDSSIVYLYDFAKNNFDVLYNFNATMGDTISFTDTALAGFCPEAQLCDKFQYVIDSVEFSTIGGLLLRKQWVTPTQHSDWVITTALPMGPTGNYPIIERIGSAKFLFGVFKMQAMEGSIRCLRCYQDSIMNFHYFSTDSLPCDYLPPLGVSDNSNLFNNFNLYPNPANDKFNIETMQESEVEILTIDGQIIQSFIVGETSSAIDISGLSKGVYFIKAKTDKGFVTKKLIKQ
jgi:hypothetical protein